MKNLLAILAVAILGTSMMFAASATNNFVVNVTCPDQVLTQVDYSVDPIDLVAGGATKATGTASWKVSNWGASGSFTAVLTGPTIPTYINYSVGTPTWAGVGTPVLDVYTFTSLDCNTYATLSIPAGTISADADAPETQFTVAYLLTVTYN